MPIERKETPCDFFLLLDRIDSYEPYLYKKIKENMMVEPYKYLFKYKNYKINNWIEESMLLYWKKMTIIQKILFYLNISVPEKLYYWDNYPRLTSYIY